MEKNVTPVKVVEFFTDQAGDWRWRALSGNGRIVADSGEGYANKIDAVDMAERIFGEVEQRDFENEGF